MFVPVVHACSQMRVEWTTRDRGNPVVKWGSEPGHYTNITSASSHTYARADMCYAPASTIGWVDPGMFHSALLEGLEPVSRYYYIVGDEVRGVQGY